VIIPILTLVTAYLMIVKDHEVGVLNLWRVGEGNENTSGCEPLRRMNTGAVTDKKIHKSCNCGQVLTAPPSHKEREKGGDPIFWW